MDIFTDIKSKINKSFQTNDINFLVSLKAFLCDKEDCPVLIFHSNENLNTLILDMQRETYHFYKNQNLLNIKKYNINYLDLYILPKNKRNILINEINELLESTEITIIYDDIRANPFGFDTLFEFINKNTNLFSGSIVLTYKTRKEFLTRLLLQTGYEKTIYETSVIEAKNNKIRDYWRNIWGDPRTYLPETTSVENILI